jgi:beta-1,4-mannosyl-glycoprotein beta-1,4-N-acetylglucosaminyltransferase
MSRSAFRLGFDRDLVRTAVQDADLGARVLASQAELEGARPAELIAGGRALKASGALAGKPALRLAQALLDLGLHEEARAILEDPALGVGVGPREVPRRLALARAQLAAGDRAGARASLDQASPGAAALIKALSPDHVAMAEAPSLVGDLLTLGLADLGAEVLVPHLQAPDPDILEAAFGVLRLCTPPAARRLLEAMERPFRLEGRAASWRSTLQVLDGAGDAGVDAEGEGSSRRQLLLRACLAEACAAARLWPAAIRRFDFVGKKCRGSPDAMPELARCVGRDLLDRRTVLLLPPDGAAPRTFDVFPYNGEARMLQLKLREMAAWTHGFVLVEADQTFPGQPKPLHFQADPAAAAAEFAGRIIPVVVDEPPAHIDFTWAREFFQKDCGVLGLQGLARPEDRVILSDADEILDVEAVRGFSGDVAPAHLRTFRYFLNCEFVAEPLHLKATVTRARFAAVHGWNYLRLGAIHYRRAEYLPAAGWHFSSIGSAEWLAYKMQCTAHEEWNFQDSAFFARFLKKLKKGGLGDGFVRRDIDDSFPSSVRDSRAALAEFIL